jgi:hypothetical protein
VIINRSVNLFAKNDLSSGSRFCSIRLMHAEKVSHGNPYPVETWKLEFGPLDVKTCGQDVNRSVPCNL